MSKISVFVASYNYGNFLAKCLDSLLLQTRSPDEILVIDDCSTDNTKEIIKPYLKKITYIRHKKNIGSSKTFNLGVKKTKGDYILALSADDWLAPTILEKEAAILDDNPEIALVYSQTYVVEAGKKKLIIAEPAGNTSYLDRKDDFKLLLTQGCFIPAMTVLVRKKVYQKLGSWDTNLRFSQDYEMWIRIAKHYPLAYISQPLAYYRIHGKNLTLVGNWEKSRISEYDYILKKHLPKTNNPENLSLRKEALYKFFIAATNNAILLSKPSKFLKYWRKAITTKPDSLFSYPTWQPLYLALKKIYEQIS